MPCGLSACSHLRLARGGARLPPQLRLMNVMVSRRCNSLLLSKPLLSRPSSTSTAMLFWSDPLLFKPSSLSLSERPMLIVSCPMLFDPSSSSSAYALAGPAPLPMSVASSPMQTSCGAAKGGHTPVTSYPTEPQTSSETPRYAPPSMRYANRPSQPPPRAHTFAHLAAAHAVRARTRCTSARNSSRNAGPSWASAPLPADRCVCAAWRCKCRATSPAQGPAQPRAHTRAQRP